MTDIETYSNKIKNDANELLESTDLIKVFSEFGEVFVVGSYK